MDGGTCVSLSTSCSLVDRGGKTNIVPFHLLRVDIVIYVMH